MTETMTLFDFAKQQSQLLASAALSPFRIGMGESQRSANAGWTASQQQRVDQAIVAIADNLVEFTADDIWAYLGDDFPVTKGLASRLNSAAKRKLIVNTGRTAIARRGGKHDHGQRLTLWARVR